MKRRGGNLWMIVEFVICNSVLKGNCITWAYSNKKKGEEGNSEGIILWRKLRMHRRNEKNLMLSDVNR